MKKFAMGILALGLLTMNAFANNDLESMGYTKYVKRSYGLHLNYVNQVEILISSERFSSSARAERFCKSHKLELDKGFNVLLLAMSGAALADPFILKAIDFEVKVQGEEISGIWSWSGKGETVIMMYNGRGTDTETVDVSTLSQFMKVSLPAICTENKPN